MSDFNQKKYIKEYMKETYKRVPLDLKKEDYEKMVEHAKRKGFDKVNTYIKDLIFQDMESKNNISVGDITQTGDNNSINIG